MVIDLIFSLIEEFIHHKKDNYFRAERFNINMKSNDFNVIIDVKVF